MVEHALSVKRFSRLHRQIWWVHGGRVVLSVVAVAMLSTSTRDSLRRQRLARVLRLHREELQP